MNRPFADPDVKIHMSLDEIIHLSRDQINGQVPRRGGRNGRKKKKSQKKSQDGNDHSVPLLSSSGGVGINVSKKSSLLNADYRRRITEALSNRAINSALIEKSKEIIPAEYKLVRSSNGVERVLVPASQYFSNSSTKKLLPPRKLNKQSATLPDKPPPLMSIPIYCPPVDTDSMKMDVDDDDNEIAVLDCPKSVKQCEVIDVESDLPVDVLEGKKLFLPGPNMMPDGSMKTLSERFTLLTGSFRF